METRIKINLDEVMSCGEPVVLELGCGTRKTPGRIGVDCVDLPEVDIVADLEAGLDFMPDNSVDEIHAEHVLEHLENFEGMMREICRVLKASGTCRVRVPHFTNPYAYSDYTHKRVFGLYTFHYFVDEAHQLRRKVPSHYTDVRIRILSQRLIFRSPFKLGNMGRKLFGRMINCCTWMQEHYEANPWHVPCHAIEVIFAPVKPGAGGELSL
ncbi:MAG TPA: methyltransferase domain-containing protein [Planctomycetota bacterium]|nr:methyltransferase domain-containing protein [Planctomycetota bacterium]